MRSGQKCYLTHSMTDERKQIEREAKRLAADRLQSVDLEGYLLADIDPRLQEYLEALVS